MPRCETISGHLKGILRCVPCSAEGPGLPQRAGERPSPEGPTEPGRVPRVARLMALALRCEELLRKGAVENQTEIARLGHVTRARVSQILNLLNLAPEIQ